MSEPPAAGGELRAAVALGILGAEESHRELLQSIVDVARAIFAAKASTIFLLDEDADELVFEAVSGEGSNALVGRRVPASTGIAGWVLVTRQPLVLEDLSSDPRFARDVAEATGYVPKALMAVPLLREERALGVLELLDRPRRAGFELAEVDLLSMFANQAAIALDVLRRVRRVKIAVEGRGEEVEAVARLAGVVEALGDERRRAAVPLLDALTGILAGR